MVVGGDIHGLEEGCSVRVEVAEFVTLRTFALCAVRLDPRAIAFKGSLCGMK